MNKVIYGTQFGKARNNKEEVSLVLLEGSLAKADAYEAIGSLIDNTRGYLAGRNFSNEVKFGGKDVWSEKMLSQIDGTVPSVYSLIGSAAKDGQKLRIVARVSVEIEQDKSGSEVVTL